jgi:outer membrane receptor protein involved in Fe transport
MNHARRDWLLVHCAPLCLATMLVLPLNSPASAQGAEASPAGDDEDENAPIIIIGQRGSAITDVAPIAELDAEAIAATGASTMAELQQAIRGQTQSADGSEPIFLLNAQRVSGYQEIGSLPPEAIEKVEVLPEQSALKFGFPPTRRVVNFITKRRFRQIEVKGAAGTSIPWGSATQTANLGLTRLRDDKRLTTNLEYRRTDPLLHSDRAIRPDTGIPFDAIGNVTAPNGGEIDPALSAASGEPVTIVPVPDAVSDSTRRAASGSSGLR